MAMTPAARAQAAIEALDRILAGEAAEKVLTHWGRAARYAGSGDRAAVRDIVYDCLRCRRSFAALGGGETGRGLVLGAARTAGHQALWFDGSAHGPAVAVETGRDPQGLEALDCPDWLAPRLRGSLGTEFEPVMRAMRHRAPVFLRVNAAKSDLSDAVARLARDGVVARPHPLAKYALEVIEGARKVQTSAAYVQGLFELQDAASQAVAEAVPLAPADRVLDLCAGGGGKTLALAARGVRVVAHDANPRRMADLPARAARAGALVTITDTPEKSAPYDVILADVPCSGSGSWRRDPEGKWALTAARLTALLALQAEILDRAARLAAPKAVLAYATCSMLSEENEAQVAAFLARSPGWRLTETRRWQPLQGGDGFGLSLLARA
jgi:16S rRNA (cytosine967-C5)-methyltransferase